MVVYTGGSSTTTVRTASTTSHSTNDAHAPGM